MAVAILCPGQGSQFVGMGADLVEFDSDAARIYEQADEILGWSVRDLSFDGPAEKLNDTRFTQPALYVHSVAAGTILTKAGVEFDYAVGHSLGEYSALALAGALSFGDGLHLVQRRAHAMAEAAATHSGTMAAVIGLHEAAVTDALDGIDGVVAANLNAPDQIVISGTHNAVQIASERLVEKGAKRVILLAVSGAFHSPLMESAAEQLRTAIENTDIHKPRVPVIANVTAQPTTDPNEIRELLVRQLTAPVLWTASVRTLVSLGVTLAYEVGPGKVLQGLVRRIDRTVQVTGAGTAAELGALRKE